MSEADDWQAITAKLHQAGFTVFYERISYEPSNPLWRAKAERDGQVWNGLGKDLETALGKLEEQTNEAVAGSICVNRPQSLSKESNLAA